MEFLRELIARAHALVAKTLRAAKRWWARHRTRMSEEVGYADAVVNVLLAVVELLTENQRVRYLAHELVGLYVAVLRVLSPWFAWEDA